MKYVLTEMDLVDSFNVCLSVPKINEESEILAILKNFAGDSAVLAKISADVAEQYSLDGLSIRNIILAADTSVAKSGDGKIEYDNFLGSISALYS